MDNGYEPLKEFWSYDMTTKNWAQMADFPGTARYDAAIFAIGTNIYVGGGDLNTPKSPGNEGYYVSDFYVFNTINGTWSQIASLPLGLGESFSFALNGKGYVTCGQRNNGYSSGYLRFLYCYDPATNTWTTKANFPGTARSYPVGFVLGGKAYVGGGYNGFWYGSYPTGITPTYYNDFYAYDPTLDSWSTKGTLINGVEASGIIAAAVGISSCYKGYLVYGNYDPWNSQGFSPTGCTNKLLEYDPVYDTWIVKATLPSSLNQAVGWHYNGTLYAD